MATDDREKQFERALARHWSNASPDSACPDAEILAAYHERTLSLEEMAHWKEHITSCVRCQEILALVEQSETVPAEDWSREVVADLLPAGRFQAMGAPAPRASGNLKATPLPEVILAAGGASEIRSVRRRPPWRWIAPLGAIAAAVMVWIGMREIRLQHLEQGHVTEIAANGSSETPSDENTEKAMRAEQTPRPQAEYSLEASRPKTPSPSVPRMAPSTTSRNSGAAAGYTAVEKDRPKDEVSTGLTSKANEITISPNSPQPPEAVANERAFDAAAPAAPAPSTSSASGGAKIAQPRKEEQKKVQTTNEEIAQDQAAELQQYSAGLKTNHNLDELSIQQFALVNRRYILSPGQKLTWRLGDAGKIELSNDHGKTWKLQDSGVATDLTAGFATSDKICWVIGKAGTLLLTTDGGKHWKMIHSPVTDDLGGIHATDDVHASIWDVPNRRSYETRDGGVTWTRVANE
jgi:hypothetical protein